MKTSTTLAIHAAIFLLLAGCSTPSGVLYKEESGRISTTLTREEWLDRGRTLKSRIEESSSKFRSTISPPDLNVISGGVGALSALLVAGFEPADTRKGIGIGSGIIVGLIAAYKGIIESKHNSDQDYVKTCDKTVQEWDLSPTDDLEKAKSAYLKFLDQAYKLKGQFADRASFPIPSPY